jgi:hypothetical protein
MVAQHGVTEGPSLFSQLKLAEQQLLVAQLRRRADPPEFDPPEFDPPEFDPNAYLQALLHDAESPERLADKLLTLRNFIRQVGAHPAAWQQVNTIVGVARSYLEITVYDHQPFLAALKAEGYAVNSWMEKVSRWAGHGHRFDSARALTEHRSDPQLHFVNDRADEEPYGPTYFFVHWDAQSVYAQRGWLLGRIAAGRTHAHQTATPQQVEAYLNRVEACQKL